MERLWWGTWSLALLVALGVLFHSYRSSHRSVLLARLAQLRQNADSLRVDFENLEGYARLLTHSAAEEAGRGKLTSDRLALLQDLAEPNLKLYWVDDRGQAIVGRPPPAWMQQRLRSRGNQTELRPLPPGWEAGRIPSQSLSRHPETPTDYLWLVTPVGDGNLILGQIRLERVTGNWVTKRLSHLPLGEELRADLSPTSLPPPSLKDNPETWRLTIPTFLEGQQPPFPFLRLELRNRGALEGNRNEYLVWLLMTLLIFALLASSLLSYRRGLEREAKLLQGRRRFNELISHELRTPVAALKMYSEILRNNLVPEKQSQYLVQIEEQTLRLQRIVDNLLGLGSLEGAGDKLSMARVDLSQLLQEVSAGREVELETPAEGSHVEGDAQALAQVFKNLLDNAFRHGEGAGVEVLVLNAGGIVKVQVRDRGPGIPESEQEAIFEPYHQVRKGQGVGLGLALVRGLVKAHQGKIRLLPSSDGACFEVSLPGWRDSLTAPEKGSI